MALTRDGSNLNVANPVPGRAALQLRKSWRKFAKLKRLEANPRVSTASRLRGSVRVGTDRATRPAAAVDSDSPCRRRIGRPWRPRFNTGFAHRPTGVSD